VIHPLLCHVYDPEVILAEATRAALETEVHCFIDAVVHDKRALRRAAPLLEAARFRMIDRWSDGYVPEEPAYFLSVAGRGADRFVREGAIGAALGEALKAEARAGAEAGRFFGFMSFSGLRAERI
jgi:hypothetical protein